MPKEDKYELYYRTGDNVCGPPFPEFAAFAESYPKKEALVLDLGCGQGRDAILFAKQGMRVTAVDTSPTGIKQMLAQAKKQKLTIDGIISDIRHYPVEQNFDIIILDRVLHMLPTGDERLSVIERCAAQLAQDGHLLIADERSNITLFKNWFEEDTRGWRIAPKMKPSFCFAQLLCKSDW